MHAKFQAESDAEDLKDARIKALSPAELAAEQAAAELTERLAAEEAAEELAERSEAARKRRSARSKQDREFAAENAAEDAQIRAEQLARQAAEAAPAAAEASTPSATVELIELELKEIDLSKEISLAEQILARDNMAEPAGDESGGAQDADELPPTIVVGPIAEAARVDTHGVDSAKSAAVLLS